MTASSIRTRRPAVFLDRDGVINVPPRERYITSWRKFRFLPGSIEAIRRLAARGKTVIVVSNQAGVGHGLVPLGELRRLTRNMLGRIRQAGGRVRAVYYCTHRPEVRCGCRKPETGMLRKASRSFRLDLRRSIVVGDNEIDVQMGRAAGCRTVLVLSGMSSRDSLRKFRTRPDRVCANLREAVNWILDQP